MTFISHFHLLPLFVVIFKKKKKNKCSSLKEKEKKTRKVRLLVVNWKILGKFVTEDLLFPIAQGKYGKSFSHLKFFSFMETDNYFCQALSTKIFKNLLFRSFFI